MYGYIFSWWASGFIVGRNSLNSDFVLKTTDGGYTFTTLSNIHNKALNSVHFKENKGVIVGKNLLGSFTTDLGETWTRSSFIGSPTSTTTLNKVKFITNEIVIATGMGGLIFKSIDGGKTFNYVQNNFQGVTFNGISFINTDSIYLSGWYFSSGYSENYLLLSTNLGDTWVNILDTNVVNSYYFLQGSTIDENGKIWIIGTYSSIFTNADIVSIFENESKDFNYSLSQNYPNPFNPITNINFTLSKASNVELVVYDVLGNKVKELLKDYREAGKHEIKINASDLSSGIYFYTLKTDGLIQTKKMNLIK